MHLPSSITVRFEMADLILELASDPFAARAVQGQPLSTVDSVAQQWRIRATGLHACADVVQSRIALARFSADLANFDCGAVANVTLAGDLASSGSMLEIQRRVDGTAQLKVTLELADGDHRVSTKSGLAQAQLTALRRWAAIHQGERQVVGAPLLVA